MITTLYDGEYVDVWEDEDTDMTFFSLPWVTVNVPSTEVEALLNDFERLVLTIRHGTNHRGELN